MTSENTTDAAQKAARVFSNLTPGDIITRPGDDTKLIVLGTRPGGWKQLGQICAEHGNHVWGYPQLLNWSPTLNAPVDRDNDPFRWWNPLSVSVQKEEATALAAEYSTLPVSDDFLPAVDALKVGQQVEHLAKLMHYSRLPDAMTTIAALRSVGATISDEQAAMFIVVKTGLDNYSLDDHRKTLLSVLFGGREGLAKARDEAAKKT